MNEALNEARGSSKYRVFLKNENTYPKGYKEELLSIARYTDEISRIKNNEDMTSYVLPDKNGNRKSELSPHDVKLIVGVALFVTGGMPEYLIRERARYSSIEWYGLRFIERNKQILKYMFDAMYSIVEYELGRVTYSMLCAMAEQYIKDNKAAVKKFIDEEIKHYEENRY